MLTTDWTHDNINELRVKHGQHKTPWQLNSNATLKILWEYSEWRQHLKNYNLDGYKNPKEIIPKGLFFQKRSFFGNEVSGANVWMNLAIKTFKHESLILAQDERWRRA